jgi:hypothetical protein
MIDGGVLDIPAPLCQTVSQRSDQIDRSGWHASPCKELGELHLVITYLQTLQIESHEFEKFPLPPGTNRFA